MRSFSYTTLPFSYTSWLVPLKATTQPPSISVFILPPGLQIDADVCFWAFCRRQTEAEDMNVNRLFASVAAIVRGHQGGVNMSVQGALSCASPLVTSHCSSCRSSSIDIASGSA